MNVKTNFKPNTKLEKYGVKAGYAFSYFLGTTILFGVLNWLDKMPQNWSYFNIMIITFSVIMWGAILKRLLK
ncbi:MAG TPA: hypothetical protein VJC39_03730 [Candidatus Nanoarchaeia archaeon]|nr:hypothetical protein [Candidatus Nanoarchaeia archaeon]